MNNNKVGEFIKEQRKKNNLTQKQLADLLQCTDKAVSRWETGKGLPEVSFLLPLSKILDVSINEILLGEVIEKENFVEKSDDLIVETIVSNNKKISHLNSVIYLLILCLSLLFIFISPFTAQPGDEMGVIFLILMAIPIISFMLGLTGIRKTYKFTFPLINVILHTLSWLILPFWSKDFEALMLYAVIIAVISYIGIFVGSITKYVFCKIIDCVNK